MSLMTPSTEERATGALLGARIGDALAMPVHWYYDRAALRSDYGLVDTYRDPRPGHPNSILWRSSYEPTEPEYDILGDERRFWGRRGVHYHQRLRAGENTLTVQLLARALEQVVSRGRWDRSEYIDLYLRFMRDPAGHRDTYVEECHRGFFENLRRGQRPERCAVAEKHIGGLAPVVPLYARLRTLGSEHEAAAADVVSHVAVTHAGTLVREAVENLLVVTREVHEGGVLGDVLEDHAQRQDLRFFRGPVMKLLERGDDDVIGRVWSPACYLDDSLPRDVLPRAQVRGPSARGARGEHDGRRRQLPSRCGTRGVARVRRRAGGVRCRVAHGATGDVPRAELGEYRVGLNPGSERSQRAGADD